LDTGSEAANTWYSLWAIHNPTTVTTAGLLSTSATAPTMPSGYTKKRRVGWIRNDASSNFLKCYWEGNWVWFDDRVQVLSGGTAATYTDLDCSSAASPTSSQLYLYHQTSRTASSSMKIRRNGSSGDMSESYIEDPSHFGMLRCPCDSSQVIEYTVGADSATADIYVCAYYDPI